MYKTIKTSIPFFCTFYMLIGCISNNKESGNIIKIEGFPKSNTIDFKEYLKIDAGYIRQLFTTDSGLILLDAKAKSNYFFSEYSLKNKKFIRSFIKKGTKFGESLGGYTSGIYKNELIWFHDIPLSRFICATIPKKNTFTDSISIKQYKMANLYYSIQMKDSTTIFASGALHATNKIQEVNLNTQKELNLFDIYNNKPANTAYYSWKKAHEGFLYLKPTNDKLVLAYRLTDKIEIFDLTNNKSTTISGPFNYDPKFTPIKRDGRDEIILTKETKCSFINGFVTNKYIYLLYVGKLRSGPSTDQSTIIYVYDWNGNPVTQLNCNQEITAFSISDDDSLIYAFNNNTHSLITGLLKM